MIKKIKILENVFYISRIVKIPMSIFDDNEVYEECKK